MTVAISNRLLEHWWVVLLQGIATLILGLLLLSSPGATLAVLILFLGIYWLVDGIISIIRIFLKDTELHWGWLLARGILGILAGILVLRHPLWATLLIPATLIIILGIQGLIIGAISIIQAFKGGGWGAAILGAVNIILV